MALELDAGTSSPMFPLPKNRPALVEDGGGGGFCSSEAVGARDERIEYVRCILVLLKSIGVDNSVV